MKKVNRYKAYENNLYLMGCSNSEYIIVHEQFLN